MFRVPPGWKVGPRRVPASGGGIPAPAEWRGAPGRAHNCGQRSNAHKRSACALCCVPAWDITALPGRKDRQGWT